MVWTTPKTWVTAELVEASEMNTYLSDNDAYLKDAPRFDGSPTVAGTMKFDGTGWPVVERTDGAGDVWDVLLGQILNDNDPTIRVRKNGVNVALLRWDNVNGYWEFDTPVTLHGSRLLLDTNGDLVLERDVSGTLHDLRVWQGTGASVIEHKRAGTVRSDLQFKDGSIDVVTGSLTVGGDTVAVRVPGTYTGNSASATSQTISLPFTPTYVVVFVSDSSAIGSGFAVAGWLASDSGSESPTLGKDGAHRVTNSGPVSGGFEVFAQLNQDTVGYHYVAIG